MSCPDASYVCVTVYVCPSRGQRLGLEPSRGIVRLLNRVSVPAAFGAEHLPHGVIRECVDVRDRAAGRIHTRAIVAMAQSPAQVIFVRTRVTQLIGLSLEPSGCVVAELDNSVMLVPGTCARDVIRVGFLGLSTGQIVLVGRDLVFCVRE